MKHIVILASGTGTNADAIMGYFAKNSQIKVQAVLSNKHNAGVLEKASHRGVPAWSFSRDAFDVQVVEFLRFLNPDLIVLAGFLWKVPDHIISCFSSKNIVNIHPSLLPKHGGKGMYGRRVHEAVILAGDTSTGITIHHVNKHYDQGNVIFQAEVSIDREDTVEKIADKVRLLEHLHYPRIIESLLI